MNQYYTHANNSNLVLVHVITCMLHILIAFPTLLVQSLILS